MLIFIIIFLLSLIYLVEASTSIARAEGIRMGHPVAGYTLQNSLGVASRSISLLLTPLIGFSADTHAFNKSSLNIIIATFILPSVLMLLLSSAKPVARLYRTLIHNMASHGKLYRFSDFPTQISKIRTVRLSLSLLVDLNNSIMLPVSIFQSKPAFYKFRLAQTLTYIPYYCSWPVTLILIGKYPEFRSTLASSTTLLTALNTLFVSAYADPFMAKATSASRLTVLLYRQFLIDRFIASCVVPLICAFVSLS